MNPNDPLKMAESMGLTLPSPAYVFGAIVFGLVGFVAWRHGRKAERPRTRWLGLALMLYPYGVSQTWVLYMLGLALCAGIWWDGR
jgi:hypothetical protein